MLPGGNGQTLNVTFTPYDTADYSSASAQVLVNVVQSQTTPTVGATAESSTYTGAPQGYPTSDVTVTGANGLTGSDGSLSFTYNGSSNVPTSAGTYSVVVTFTPNDTTDYTNGSSTTTWTIKAATPTVTAAAQSTVYTGDAQPYPGTDVTVTGANGLTGSDGSLSFTYNGSSNVPTSAGTYSVVATFTPTDTTDYTNGSTTTTWTIKAATPTVTAAAQSTVYTGDAQPYPGTDVTVTGANGLTSSDGSLSFTYNGSSNVPTSAGTYSVVVAFTPNDTTDYTNGSTTTTWTIKAATPTVTAAAQSTFYTGVPQPYPGTDVTVAGANGLSSSDGSLNFTYNGSSNVPTSAGTYSVVVTFTPTDTTDYTNGSTTTNWTIKAATPVITWNNPSAIAYFTPLGSNQLDAVANVTGSFVYTPPAGTVLTAGTQTLSAKFTPADSTDYKTTTATVQLVVLGPGVRAIGTQLYFVGGGPPAMTRSRSTRPAAATRAVRA